MWLTACKPGSMVTQTDRAESDNDSAMRGVRLPAQTRGAAQANRDTRWSERTSRGDPDFEGEWTIEGEYGVPLERPVQYATRQFLTATEHAKRLEDVRVRDERDLVRVDVLSGKVDGPNAPIPRWCESDSGTPAAHWTSRRCASAQFPAISK